MAKTTTRPKAIKRAPKKKASAAPAAASRNGMPQGQMSEKSKQLTIRGFQLAYEQHHRKQKTA